jgi:CHASE2 domain-containing sensor protein
MKKGAPSRKETWKDKLRRYRHLIPMALILVVLTVPELERAWTWDPCVLQETDLDFFTTLLYRPVTNWVLSFKPTPKPSVVIVYIDPETDPPELLTNTCLARVFFAHLVDDISNLGAKAIVIDKFYSDSSCNDSDSNRIFKTALTNKKIPIVVGMPTHLLTDKKGTDQGCLALSNKFDFGVEKVKYGLTRLNSDILKIPLQWPVFHDNDDPKVDPPRNDPPDIGDTISLMAARQINPSIDKSGPVKMLLDAKVHPYTNFLELDSTNAMTVRCSTEPNLSDVDKEKVDCPKLKWPLHSLGQQKLDLAGKIVVIGDLSDQDMQPFPDEKKERPGVYLQANYIQSILDGRFLREVPLYITLITLVVYIVCTYCLHLFLDNPERAFQISLLIFAIVISVSIFALLKWSYFTPLWALWTAAIVVAVRYLETKAHHLSTQVMHDAPHLPHGGKR